MPGEELLDAFEQGRLETLLPTTPAIYMWKLSTRPGHAAALTPDGLLDYVDWLLRTPYGAVQARRLNHFSRLDKIVLSGDGLPGEKRRQLLAWISSRDANRRWLVDYVSTLAEAAPALYVGETHDLATRSGQHMSGQTDFGQIVSTDPDLTWLRLVLHYSALGGTSVESAALRKSLEYVTTVLTVGGFTQSPG